jgi:NADP-dependent 3-hydroxy acid dehydrogenase YdfG
MNPVKDTVVVVTGASSGIGMAIAEKLSAHGALLVLGARREDRLRELAARLPNPAEYRVTDVTRREQVEALARAALDRFGRIDAWVNNAGVMPLSPLEMDKVEEWDRMVDVNVKGVLWGIHAALGPMLKQGSGHIVNISSVAGLTVFPAAAVYCGTKFAVKAIGEGLRMETAGRVRVTTVYPGAVATELPDSISVPEVREGMGKFLDMAIPPEAIANGVLYALSQPADVAVNDIVIRPSRQDL